MVSKRKRRPGSREGPILFPLSDDRVWKPVLDARRVFLFLDLDGTLAEIRAHPGEVGLSPERRRCLEELAVAPWVRVAVVSGRRVEEVRNLIGIETFSYIGLHGLEVDIPHAERWLYPVSREVIDALQSVRRKCAGSAHGVPGIWLEDKGLTLALHLRLAEKQKAGKVVESFLQAVRTRQERGVPLELLRGKEVVEVKPTGADKGRAVTRLWKRYGRGAFPVYVGDDVTDETAFESLREKGMTILIAKSPRRTVADYYLRNPGEVYSFLRRLIALRAEKRG